MASSSKSASASVSTSASDGKNCYQYDVFINHRGPDVKKTFASHLYHSLTERGVKVFLDKAELQKGDSNWCQIKDAIRVASVHIALFSPTYAHSNWCLNELLLMLESMRESRSTIIPVFFGVKPWKLRWTEGEDKENEYAEGLRELQNKGTADSQPRYDSNTIQKWKKALHDVADLNGFELEAYNDDEGQLLVDVVQLVLEKFPTPPLYISKYPTGKVRDFEEKVLLRLKHLETIVLWTGKLCQRSLGLKTLPEEFCQLPEDLNVFEQKIPESIGQLKQLKIPEEFYQLRSIELELKYCRHLKSLPPSKIPESIGKLKHLEKIVLRVSLSLPEDFCHLRSLKHLELRYCLHLKSLPDSFGNLSYCTELRMPPQLTHQPFYLMQEMILISDFKELPSAIGNLSNLKILTLESSCLEMLPPSFGELRSLEKLKLSGCSLKCFPDSIRMLPQLKSLSIWGIKNLEKLEMKEWPSREVTFKKVGGEVETATDSRGRGVLSKLDASKASSSKAVFPNLQRLEIGRCHNLVKVGALPTTLQTLSFYGCTKLEELPSMETLVSLEVLHTGWRSRQSLKN